MSMGCFGGLCFSQPTLANLLKNFQNWSGTNGMRISRYGTNNARKAYKQFENNLRSALNNTGWNRPNSRVANIKASRNLTSQYNALKKAGKLARKRYNSSASAASRAEHTARHGS